MVIRKKVVAIILVTFMGCSQNVSEEVGYLESLVGLRMEKYVVLENEENINMNDYLKTVVLQFDRNEYIAIIEKVKRMPWYNEIKKFDGLEEEFIVYDTLLSNGDFISIVFMVKSNKIKYTKSSDSPYN